MRRLLVALLLLALCSAAPAAVNIVRGNLTTLWGVRVAITPTGIAPNHAAEQTFTVTGVLASDVIIANKPTAQTGLGVVNVRATAANTVGITFMNNTAVTVTPTSETWTFTILRPEDTPLPSIVQP